MLHAFIGGSLLGLILSITPGPAFFTIIQTSIDRGFKNAIQIAFGIMMSDVVLIFISFFGLTAILQVGHNQTYIAVVGGIILMLFGIYTFGKKPEMLLRRSSNFKTPTRNPRIFTYIGKGFLLNFLNPLLWIFWFSVISALSRETDPKQLQSNFITFFSGTFIMIFAMDLLKSYIGARIKKYLKLRTQYRINMIVGVLLILFGFSLIVRSMIDFL